MRQFLWIVLIGMGASGALARAQQSSANALGSASTPTGNPGLGADSGLAAGALAEEGNLDAPAAIRSYQAVIDRYDRERAAAAHAIFRLGEVYRKLGRAADAKTQYARILREFPDQTKLAELSQENLIEAPKSPAGESLPPQSYASDASANSRAIAERRRQIEQAQDQIDRLEDRLRSLILPIQQAEQKLYQDDGKFDLLNNSDSVAVPLTISADPKFHELKEAWEEAMVREPRNQKALDAASKQLIVWVQNILKVELRDAVMADSRELNKLNATKTEVESRLRDVKKQLAEFQQESARSISEESAKRAIIENLRRIDAAKEQWALENKQKKGTHASESDVAAYLHGNTLPKAVAGEKYTINPIGQAPTATLPDGSVFSPESKP